MSFLLAFIETRGTHVESINHPLHPFKPTDSRSVRVWVLRLTLEYDWSGFKFCYQFQLAPLRIGGTRSWRNIARGSPQSLWYGLADAARHAILHILNPRLWSEMTHDEVASSIRQALSSKALRTLVF